MKESKSTKKISESEYPHFLSHQPDGIDKYEGQSGQRVAKAIENHIVSLDNDEFNKVPKIIGLEGKWGSGKSNVVSILELNIEKKYYLFEYDAWGHQEDLQRRSFLETLTDNLLNNKKVDLLPRECSKLNSDGKKENWSDKLKNLLARKRETYTRTKPKLSKGLSGAIIIFVLTPITSYVANSTEYSNFAKLIFSLLPLFIILGVWIISSIKNKKLLWSELFEIYSNDKITEIVNESISENEPSVKEFKDWMRDLSFDLKKPIIIVFDNMDRLPADKVKELWSSIHTFFAEERYKNIWVVIPYDKMHLANAFGDDDVKHELSMHFISKTFPINYRVPPPVMTDWKKLFNEYFDIAFNDVDVLDKTIIRRCLGLFRPNLTPREIISFINEIVALKKTWNDEIPIISMSVFVLAREEILANPIESILSGSYLKKIGRVLKNDEGLQRQISALTYGINVNLAEQIPLKKYISNTLNGEPNYDINEFSSHKHFLAILEEEINEIDPLLIEKAVSRLKLLDQSIVDATSNWNTLAQMHMDQSIEPSFEETNKSILLNSDNETKGEYTKFLCATIRRDYNDREEEEFIGSLFFDSMNELDEFISDNNLEINLEDYLLEKTVSPEIFVDYVSKAKNNQKKYKLICDNNLLNEHIIGILNTSDKDLKFIEYLIEDSLYSFEKLKEKIDLDIPTNEFPIARLSQIIQIYKLVSEEKPLSQQLTQINVQQLISTISDKTTDEYYDAISIAVARRYVDVPYTEGLEDEVAERLEFFNKYDSLLILSKDWNNQLLRKSVKTMTEKSYGINLEITKILPHFSQIQNALSIDGSAFLEELSKWELIKEEITNENLVTLVPSPSFYKFSSILSNELCNHINELALGELNKVTDETLYSQKNSDEYYWFDCASTLIIEKLIGRLPKNLTEFTKKVLIDIASQTYAIPIENSNIGVIINKANKKILQSTIKHIGMDFCNRTKAITPNLFLYFSKGFDLFNKLTSRDRDGDISSVILNTIITNPDCLDFILDHSQDFVSIINNSGDDAIDLKNKIALLMEQNNSQQLKSFGKSIGIESDE